MPRVYTYVRSATAEGSAQPNPSEPFGPWLARHPDAEIAGSFEDLGVSGLTSTEERPGFAALLAALKTEPAEIVLVPSLEHLTRDRGALPQILAHLTSLRVQLLTVERLPTGHAGQQRLTQSVLDAIQTYGRQRRSRKARV